MLQHGTLFTLLGEEDEEEEDEEEAAAWFLSPSMMLTNLLRMRVWKYLQPAEIKEAPVNEATELCLQKKSCHLV